MVDFLRSVFSVIIIKYRALQPQFDGIKNIEKKQCKSPLKFVLIIFLELYKSKLLGYNDVASRMHLVKNLNNNYQTNTNSILTTD